MIAQRVEVAYHRRRMLRISWGLAFLLASVIAIVARKPRLFGPILIVFVIWFIVQRANAGRRSR